MKIITSYLIQAALWILVYLWLSYGMEGAHSILVAYMWICAILMPLAVVGGAAMKPESSGAKEMHALWHKYKYHCVLQRVTTTAFYCTMIWNGHTILATICVVFWILMMCVSSETIKRVEALRV